MKVKKLKKVPSASSVGEASSNQATENCCTCHFFRDEDETTHIRSSLLKWYDEHKRELPWRQCSHDNQNKRLYEVWVSEIMCQQTQVVNVIPYYNKWIKRWPTVERLAKASVDQVIEAWAGLGYYSRGRRLLEGSQVVMNDFDGKIPTTSTDLLKHLPGVGKYTACAIASICSGEPVGVVDGNVIRVLSRLRCIGADTSQPTTMDSIWELSHALVDRERPGDFNQSIMELGATVCTPKNPSCSSCPVQNFCQAFKRVEEGKLFQSSKQSLKCTDGNENITDVEDIVQCHLCLPTDVPWDQGQGVMNFPRKAKKKPPKEQQSGVCLVQKMTNDGQIKYLMVQRPEKGLLAGMWEFPSVEIPPECTAKKRKELEEEYIKDQLGVIVQKVNQRTALGDIVHIFTHIRQTYEVDLVVALEDDIVETLPSIDQKMNWVTEKEMESLGVSTAMKKVFACVDGGNTPNKSKKRKHEDKTQPKLDSFFQRKSQKKTSKSS